MLSTLRERTGELRELLDKMLKGTRHDVGEVTKIDNSQVREWNDCRKMVLEMLTDENCNQIIEICKTWTMADMKAEMNTAIFPPIKRGYKDGDFPVKQPQVVFSEKGASKLAKAFRESGGSVGLSVDDVKKGFLKFEHKISPIDEKHIMVGGVPMRKWTGDEIINEEDIPDVIPTASWFGSQDSRWNEAHRHIPHTLSSTYRALLMWMQHANLDAEAREKHGFVCLATGVFWMCVEWTGRHGSGRLRKTDDGDVRRMMRDWMTASSTPVPHWIEVWRQANTPEFKYVTPEDCGMSVNPPMGAMEWSIESLSKQTGSAQTDADRKQADVPIAFIERIRGRPGAPLLTNSAMTLTAPLRVFYGLSTGLQTMNSMHLHYFIDYYRVMLEIVGEIPGHQGKPLDKLVAKLPDLILASPKSILAPTTMIPELGKVNAQCKMHEWSDRKALYSMASALGCNPSEESIMSVIEGRHAKLGPILRHIYDEYKHHPIHTLSAETIAVCEHLRGASSIDGYLRSDKMCLGSTAYISREFRLDEGIDSDNIDPALPVSVEEERIVTEVLRHLVVPAADDMSDLMMSVYAAKSSGPDSVGFRFSERVASGGFGTTTSTREQFANSNKKDSVLSSMMWLLVDYTKFMQSLVADPSKPRELGLRSVAARIMRLIVNVPIQSQGILKPMYDAISKYLEENKKYALAHQTGKAFADMIDQVNHSMLCLLDSTAHIVAFDASKLDQHLGVRGHETFVRAINNMTTSLGDTDFGNKFGETYLKCLAGVFRCWNKQYYVLSVDKANGLEMRMTMDTNPSGALTTANTNTIQTEAVLNTILKELNMMEHTAALRYWGDDSYGVFYSKPDQNFVDFIDNATLLAKQCGQKFDTHGGAYNGRVVDFLKKLYIGGQRISRSVAYDQERPIAQEFGQIGSIMDKIVLLASRGGNAEYANVMIIIHIVLSGRARLFGKQAYLDINTMLAPGGMLNRVSFGFPSPNDKLWLSMHWKYMSAPGHEYIMTKVRQDANEEIGERVISEMRDKDLAVKWTINGEQGTGKYSDIMTRARGSLLKSERAEQVKAAEAQATQNGYQMEDYVKYENYPENATSAVLGRVIKEKYMSSTFKEKSFVKAGLMALTRGGELGEQAREEIDEYKGLKLGTDQLIFTYDEDTYVKVRYLKSREAPRLLFEVNVPGHPVEKVREHWTPYWGMPLPHKLTLAFLGVSAKASFVGIRDLKNKFDPSKFRVDLTAERVMDEMSKAPSATEAMNRAQRMGFDEESITKMMQHLDKIPLIRDVAEAQEYGGLDPVYQDAADDSLRALLQKLMPLTQLDSLDQMIVSVIYTHFVTLLVAEVNMSCFLSKQVDGMLIRLPKPSLRKLVN